MLTKSFRLFPIFLLAFSCANENQTSNEFSSNANEVQASWLNKGYELARDDGPRVTGALFTPFYSSGSPVLMYGTNLQSRSTCGVTFISPHYAITASHCADYQSVPDPASQPLVVETYDITSLKGPVPTTVTGIFPNYSHGYLSSDDGYNVTKYRDCYVVSRCGREWGSYNCDFEADIALIKCNDRPSTGKYVTVARSDSLTGPVEMYWFHEVLDMPTERPTKSEALDLYNHYWLSDYSHTSNYHYHPDNQLLPLHSIGWNNGTKVPNVRIGRDRWGNVRTDLYGCHGSSGSGAFQRDSNGVLELLGPVVLGNLGDSIRTNPWADSSGYDLLCQNYFKSAPKRSAISYTDSYYTRMLAEIALNDPGEGFIASK